MEGGFVVAAVDAMAQYRELQLRCTSEPTGRGDARPLQPMRVYGSDTAVELVVVSYCKITMEQGANCAAAVARLPRRTLARHVQLVFLSSIASPCRCHEKEPRIDCDTCVRTTAQLTAAVGRNTHFHLSILSCKDNCVGLGALLHVGGDLIKMYKEMHAFADVAQPLWVRAPPANVPTPVKYVDSMLTIGVNDPLCQYMGARVGQLVCMQLLDGMEERLVMTCYPSL